jgi:hypothetical protein
MPASPRAHFFRGGTTPHYVARHGHIDCRRDAACASATLSRTPGEVRSAAPQRGCSGAPRSLDWDSPMSIRPDGNISGTLAALKQTMID